MKMLNFLFLIFFMFITTILSQVPQKINYQGLLTDANSSPLNGDFNLTFKLYTVPTGGSSIWEEKQNVKVSDGIFNIILGSVNLLDLSFDKVYWLGISVNDESELEPRTQLTSSPYSLMTRSVVDSSISTIKLKNGIVTTPKLANGSVSTEKIADSSVTGSKLCNSALQAGSNVSITRQRNGALKIDASGGGGFKLPFNGSTSSSGAAFSIQNTGSGDGINILSAGANSISIDTANNTGIFINKAPFGLYLSQSDIGFYINKANSDGIEIFSAAYGMVVTQASNAGVAVGNAPIGLNIIKAGDKGISIDEATNDGVAINKAGRFGLNVANSLRGVNLNTTLSDGLLVGNAGRHGLYVLKSTKDGVLVQHAGNPSSAIAAANQKNGIEVQGAGSDGIFVGRADQIGLNILSTGSNGIQVAAAGIDGMQIQSAGRDGVRVSSAADYGINASGTKGAGFFGGNVTVTGDLTSKNLAVNTQPSLGTQLSVQGNAAISGKLVVTEGSPGASFATNIIQVDKNSATDPIADAWTVYSSRRWKTNIQTINQAVEKIKRLRGVTYNWKATGKHDIGLIAEEVGEVFPEIVSYEKNGVDAKSVDYSRLVSVLIEAVKQQQTQIDALNKRLDALTSASQ